VHRENLITSVVPAIANAIEGAVRVRVRDLPITAEKVCGTAASAIAPKLNLVCEDFLLREVMWRVDSLI
jgi:hypothetical protein